MDWHNSERAHRSESNYDSRDSRRGYDNDRLPPRYDDRPPPPPPSSDMFHFRGAANRERDSYVGGGGDSYRPGGQSQGGDSYRRDGNSRRDNGRSFDFNFQSGNGVERSFAPTTDYPSARRGPRQQGSSRGRPQNARGSRGGRGRGRGGFVPRRAGDRALLRTEREPTPEQLEGMNDGQARFKVLENLSESESEDMELGTPSDDERDEEKSVNRPPVPMDNSDSEDEHPRAKRARVHSPEPAQQEETKPKWSNPDPYWALPPTDESQTKKKDVVKLIRKAKVDAAKKEDEANAASDFISLNFDDDDDDDKDNDHEAGSESGELSDAEHETAGQSNQNNGRSFSHLDNLHPNRIVAPPATSQKAINMALPAGRLDVWPPPAPDADYDIAMQRQGGADTTAKARQKNADKNKKRKHPARDLGDIIEEWLAPDDADPTPWLNLDAPGCPSLHSEILDFYDYVRPRDYEEHVRLSLVQRIQRAIDSRFPGVQIKPFGSFASGLYLPTADMDLVAVSPDFLSRGWPRIATNNQMRKFADCLTQARIVKPGSLTVISGARVPIIKLVDNETGLRVDVSFENNSGLIAQKTFEDWKQQYPAMPIIVALIKQFLVMRGMSEVFSGGLGGYSVICLVVSNIRRLINMKGPDWDQMQNLDNILMSFLIHYGEDFNRYTTGIEMEPWRYFSKTQWNPQGTKPPQRERLLIVDPNKYNNDISGGSKNVDVIFDAFRDAYYSMNDSLTDVEDLYEKDRERNSILERVWGGNYGLFDIQRARLKALWDGQTRPAGFPRGNTRTAAPQAVAKRIEGSKSNKRQKTSNGGMGTRESPIDLEDSQDDMRLLRKGKSNVVGKSKPHSPPTFQSINKPKGHSGGKAKGGSSNQPSSQQASNAASNNVNVPKGKPAKKEKKGNKKMDEAKAKQKEMNQSLLSEKSRALAFAKAHPGVQVPDRLSRETFKTLTKKHGPGIAS